MNQQEPHNALIIDQFSKQSVPFTKVSGHLDAIDTLIMMSSVTAIHSVLDVACGPGLVACEFAKVAERVVGLDVTPAMLNVARNRQQELGLNNIEWKIGDALQLPFDEESFDIVVTRYSFHHLLDPSLAIKELMRVCKAGGTVLIADVCMPAEKSANYDRLELLRDPSHTHALTEVEFDDLFGKSGLQSCRFTKSIVKIDLEEQLKASFPDRGGSEQIRQIITSDIGHDQLGINAYREAGKIYYSVPIRIYVGDKQGIVSS